MGSFYLFSLFMSRFSGVSLGKKREKSIPWKTGWKLLPMFGKNGE
jgi:hypothetical protein